MPTEEITAYEEHTQEGKPIREIARERKVAPSTVLRQTRRIEEMRDDPVVDKYLENREKGMPDDEAKMLAAVERLRVKDHLIALMPDHELAGVYDGGERKVVLPLTVHDVGAMVVRKMITPMVSEGGVVRYKLRQGADVVNPVNLKTRRAGQKTRLATVYARWNATMDQLVSRKYLTQDHKDDAFEIYNAWEQIEESPTRFEDFEGSPSPAAQAFAALPAGYKDVLRLVILEGENMTGAEEVMGWPARSGKVMFRYALETWAESFAELI